MKTHYYIAWWNVENLFDTFDSTQRPEWLQRALKRELKGWTADVLRQKIDNLGSIIRQMNNGKGPDILGVCEVENKPVLEKLVSSLDPLNRNYGIVHHDSTDQRGIDVAFIYDRDKFEFEMQFSYTVLKRTATRDLFQANFKTLKGYDLILIGNHWPARSAGVYESEPYRIIAAETLSYWMDRITEIKGKDIAVISMGDFNDEPLSRSVTDYALGSNSLTKVTYARSPRLFNLMWPFHGDGLGTFYYNNFPFVFDQFLVSKEMIQFTGRPKVARDQEGKFNIGIERFPEMITGGRYPTPKRFGRPAKKSSYDPKGYSDHFPISVVVEE
ncbi:MAG: endonuclease/exonuclease/phosphatase family protein [Bacteroidales bacterium]